MFLNFFLQNRSLFVPLLFNQLLHLILQIKYLLRYSPDSDILVEVLFVLHQSPLVLLFHFLQSLSDIFLILIKHLNPHFFVILQLLLILHLQRLSFLLVSNENRLNGYLFVMISQHLQLLLYLVGPFEFMVSLIFVSHSVQLDYLLENLFEFHSGLLIDFFIFFNLFSHYF